MKNYSFYISLSIVASVLSGCAITQKQAPIEYHHRNSNVGSSKNYDEKTVPIISNDSEIISSAEDLDYKEAEVITPTSDDNDENYAMPDLAKKPLPKKLITKIQEEPLKQVQVTSEYVKPTEGKVVSKFGQKTDYGINKGINIAAPEGTKVVASAAGKVIYADYDATFGNLLIIKLNDKNVVLSYAHLEKLAVNKGASLKQGDVIGGVGKTGKVKQSQLHFAVREGKTAIDPLKFVSYSD